MSRRLSQAEGSSGVSAKEWRELYDNLGEDIRAKESSGNDPESSDEWCLRCAYQVESLQETRERMRAIDSTLPEEDVDGL